VFRREGIGDDALETTGMKRVHDEAPSLPPLPDETLNMDILLVGSSSRVSLADSDVHDVLLSLIVDLDSRYPNNGHFANSSSETQQRYQIKGYKCFEFRYFSL